MSKKRQRGTRPSYHNKCEIVLRAIRRLIYEERLRGIDAKGFTMSQIAEEAGYARSQRFMETLYSMKDDKLIEIVSEDSDNPLFEKYVYFRLPSSVKQQSFVS